MHTYVQLESNAPITVKPCLPLKLCVSHEPPTKMPPVLSHRAFDRHSSAKGKCSESPPPDTRQKRGILPLQLRKSDAF